MEWQKENTRETKIARKFAKIQSLHFFFQLTILQALEKLPVKVSRKCRFTLRHTWSNNVNTYSVQNSNYILIIIVKITFIENIIIFGVLSAILDNITIFAIVSPTYLDLSQFHCRPNCKNNFLSVSKNLILYMLYPYILLFCTVLKMLGLIPLFIFHFKFYLLYSKREFISLSNYENFFYFSRSKSEIYKDQLLGYVLQR